MSTTYGTRRKNASNPFYKSLWFIIIAVLLGIMAGGIFLIFIMTDEKIVELPAPKQASIIYDINHKEICRYYVENRIELSPDKMPESIKKAIVSVEDSRFYEHFGVDPKGIARAIWTDIRNRDYTQGASTITQQLARNVLLTNQKTMSRKFQEIFLAMKIEQSYTKDEILTRYLNQIYLGKGLYGVETASRYYFGKTISELQPHQIAVISGLPKNPNGYSPFDNPEKALERRNIVLDKMVDGKILTVEQAESYKKKPLDLGSPPKEKKRAAYFRDYVSQRLKNKNIIPEEKLNTAGYKIYTTIDIKMQDAAETAIENLVGGTPDKYGVLQPQLSLVAIDPRTGYIKAMIGGRDFNNTQLNRATRAYRQPGSTIKPFVYTAAIDLRKYSPSSIVVDEEVSFPPDDPNGWKPKNYDLQYRGNISLRHALEMSINTIATKLVYEITPNKIVEYAQKMGLESFVLDTKGKNDLNLPSLALGGLTKGVTPLELTAAYSPLANQGIYSEPIAILAVKDSNGNTLYEERSHKKAVLSAETAYVVTDMMRGVILRGTGTPANIQRPAAGKTGTSSNYTNAWFVGYTPDLIASVWIGNDSQNKTVTIGNKTVSSARAAQIWGIFMKKALSGTPATDFTPPAGVVTNLEVCGESGELATPNCVDVQYETFLSGAEPTVYCHLHSDGTEIQDPNTIQPDGTPDPNAVPDANSDVKQEGALNGLINNLMNNKKKKQITVKVCTESNLIASPNCPAAQVVNETFDEGSEPKNVCNVHTGKN